MNLFTFPPCWYVVTSIAVSIYQGWRGYIFQHQFAERQRQQDPAGTVGARTTAQLWFSRTLADGQYYFLTTLSGFAALLLAYRILNSTHSIENMSAGTAAVFIFLSLFGILGVTGKLPDLLQQGKFPTIH